MLPILIEATTTAPTTTQPVLNQALSVSGISMVAIFVVMGAFGILIALLGKMFPEKPEA
jgi:hypothetical protein